MWNKNVYVLLITCALITLAFGSGIAALIISFVTRSDVTQISNRGNAIERLCDFIEGYLWISAVTDITIATLLIIKLIQERRRLHFSKDEKPSSDIILWEILKMSIVSAFLTVLLTGSNAIVLSITVATSNANVALYFQVPLLYTISVTYTLNCREGLRKVDWTVTLNPVSQLFGGLEEDSATTEGSVPTTIQKESDQEQEDPGIISTVIW